MTRLGMRFPSDSYIEYSEVIIGKWLGRIGSLISIAFFAVLSSLCCKRIRRGRCHSRIENTPLEVTVLVIAPGRFLHAEIS